MPRHTVDSVSAEELAGWILAEDSSTARALVPLSTFFLEVKLTTQVAFMNQHNIEPLEIVTKKWFYRADRFTARDIFDLAVLINEIPEVVAENSSVVGICVRGEVTYVFEENPRKRSYGFVG